MNLLSLYAQLPSGSISLIFGLHFVVLHLYSVHASSDDSGETVQITGRSEPSLLVDVTGTKISCAGPCLN